jgi:hypothetical protein
VNRLKSISILFLILCMILPIYAGGSREDDDDSSSNYPKILTGISYKETSKNWRIGSVSLAHFYLEAQVFGSVKQISSNSFSNEKLTFQYVNHTHASYYGATIDFAWLDKSGEGTSQCSATATWNCHTADIPVLGIPTTSASTNLKLSFTTSFLK